MSEIRYTPNDEPTLGNVIRRQWKTQADFSYSILGNVISIIDLDLGNRSVTNDIENVLRKIEYYHQSSIVGCGASGSESSRDTTGPTKNSTWAVKPRSGPAYHRTQSRGRALWRKGGMGIRDRFGSPRCVPLAADRLQRSIGSTRAIWR